MGSNHKGHSPTIVVVCLPGILRVVFLRFGTPWHLVLWRFSSGKDLSDLGEGYHRNLRCWEWVVLQKLGES